MLDAINEDGVYRIVIKSSAQVGKTELVLNTIGYFVDYDACPILVLQPTLVLAEAFSKDRLAPMIRDTPALTGKVKDARSRDSDNTLLHKKYPGGQITLAGANSPSSLASRPIRIVLCDETDRYPKSAGTEGDPVKLAQKRTDTFFNYLHIEVSTPTVKGESHIDTAYLESDQRQYHVPCPLCEQMQVLEWAQISYKVNAAGDPEDVRYRCIHCNELFDDSKKAWMLARGKWIARQPFRGIAGFHLNALYSPWSSWKKIAREREEAKSDPEKLKVWTNTALGETYEEQGEAPEWKRLYDRRERYKIGEVPWQVVFLTAGVDVQKNRLELEIVGWARDKQTWSIDYRTIMGDTATPGPYLELDRVLNEQFPHETGLMLPIRMMAVDSGFNTSHVYNWARRHPADRVMVIKGVDNAAAIVGQIKSLDVRKDGRRVRRGLNIWPIGVSIAKSELYSWLRLESPIEGQEYPPGYCHFPEYSEEFFMQITAEQLVTRVVKKRTYYEWKKTRDRNEALDCRIMNRAAAARIGIDKFRPEHWDALFGELGKLRPKPPDSSADSDSTPKPPSPPSAPTIHRRKSKFL